MEGFGRSLQHNFQNERRTCCQLRTNDDNRQLDKSKQVWITYRQSDLSGVFAEFSELSVQLTQPLMTENMC